mmetsp:Transcript_13969/g.33107  ORF Transcript_13969/g.33107 Transcript_13969/m.33107 type:complete len:103 (+) Transcript_13969:77-385(+)
MKFHFAVLAFISGVASGFVLPRSGVKQCSKWTSASVPTNIPRNQVLSFLTPEQEPEEFFMSEQEKLPPMERIKDPLVLLGAFSVFIPFILLGVAYAAGWVGQ